MNNPVPQPTSVTAVDIVLEPDETMLEHARTVNARLRGNYPQGFSLDAAPHPHISMLQRFVKTADLDSMYNAAEGVFAGGGIVKTCGSRCVGRGRFMAVVGGRVVRR